MDIPLLIHECSRRGVTLEAGESGLQILASPGVVDDGFRAIISAHKAAIVAHFAARLTGFSPHQPAFSPHDPSFSPLSPCGGTGGLSANPLSTSNSIPLSPLSPLEKREELRVEENANDKSERRDYVRVYSDSPLRDGGLSGLNRRNILMDIEVTSSPNDEKSGLVGGLNGLNGGLNPSQTDCTTLRHHVPPTWETLSLQRWGPAMDDDRPWVVAEDDEPGIVIDTPDRGRLMAALRSRILGGPAP